MELKVIENTKSKLVFELAGEGHTFCNMLVKELWTDANVKTAAYKISHPLIGIPTVIVETNTKATPKEVLKEAVDRLKKGNDEFRKKFTKAIR